MDHGPRCKTKFLEDDIGETQMTLDLVMIFRYNTKSKIHEKKNL